MTSQTQTAAAITDLKIYQDGDRYVVGRSIWQSCTSMTVGVADAFDRRELRQVMAWARAQTADQLEAAKRTYWTDGRFERLEQAGHFGPAW